MDTDSGRFVADEDAKPDMNRYGLRDIVVIGGDEFEVEEITNRAGRGRLLLRALSAEDRAERAVDDVLEREPFLDGSVHRKREAKPKKHQAHLVRRAHRRQKR